MFGFSHRRRGHCPLGFLLALFGIRSALRHRDMTDVEREEARTKARAFRAKLREAWAVWDDKDAASDGPEGHA